LAGFEVLSRQLFETADVSSRRVLAAPQKRVKTTGFRAISGSFFASLFVDTKSDSPAGAKPGIRAMPQGIKQNNTKQQQLQAERDSPVPGFDLGFFSLIAKGKSRPY
jgi:hypothetical protein